MRFTLITPVRNMAPYLDRFLDSVVKQSFTDYELIIMDYGSTDGSLAIISKYTNSNIRLARTAGTYETPAAARNDALSEIKGEFVLFPDADDWLEHNILEVLDKQLSDNNVDTILFQFIEEFESYSKNRNRYPYAPGIYKMPADQEMFLPINNIMIPGSNCAKCYSSKIIRENNLTFNSSILLGDDVVFDYSYFKYSESFIILADYLYHYRIHISALTKKYHEDKIDYFLPHIREMISALEEWNILNDENLYIIQLRLLRMVFNCFNNCFHPRSPKKYMKKIAEVRKISQHPDVVSAVSAAKKRKYKALSFSERLVIFLLNRNLFYLLGTLVYLRLRLREA